MLRSVQWYMIQEVFRNLPPKYNLDRITGYVYTGVSLFQAFWSSTGSYLRSVQTWWENPMTPPPPRPLYPPMVVPKASEYVVLKKVFQKILWEDPQTPLIQSSHICACCIISLIFCSRDYSTCFSGFLVLGQADPWYIVACQTHPALVK